MSSAPMPSVPVEAGHVLALARALGDANPIYRDAAYAAGTDLGCVIAPPTFVLATMHWQEDIAQRPEPGRLWPGSSSAPTGSPPPEQGAPALVRSMHAGQAFDYHRPVRVGDVLSVSRSTGDPVEKKGRTGRIVFETTVDEYRNQDGELVVTSTTTTARIHPAVEAGR